MATKMGKTLAFTAVSGIVAGLAACGGAPAATDMPGAPTPEAPAAPAEGGEKATCSGDKAGGEGEKASCGGEKGGEKGSCGGAK